MLAWGVGAGRGESTIATLLLNTNRTQPGDHRPWPWPCESPAADSPKNGFENCSGCAGPPLPETSVRGGLGGGRVIDGGDADSAGPLPPPAAAAAVGVSGRAGRSGFSREPGDFRALTGLFPWEESPAFALSVKTPSQRSTAIPSSASTT